MITVTSPISCMLQRVDQLVSREGRRDFFFPSPLAQQGQFHQPDELLDVALGEMVGVATGAGLDRRVACGRKGD